MRKKQQRYIKNIKEDLIPFLKDHIQLVFIGFGVLLAVMTFVAITISDTNKGKDKANADTISAPTVSSNPGGFVIPRASSSSDSASLVSSSVSSLSSVVSSSSIVTSSSVSTTSSTQFSSLSSIASSQVSSLSSVASSFSSAVSSTVISSVNSSTAVSSSNTSSITVSSLSSSKFSSAITSSLSSNGVSSSVGLSSSSNQSSLSSNLSSSTASSVISSLNTISAQSSISCVVYNPDPIKGAPVCLTQSFTPGQNTVRTGGLDWLLGVAVIAMLGSIVYYRQVVMKGKHKLHTKEKKIK